MKVGILVECGRDGLEDVVVRRICDLLRAETGEPAEIDIVTMDNKENLILECGLVVARLLGDGCDRVVILWDERPAWPERGEPLCWHNDRQQILASLRQAGVNRRAVHLVCIEREFESWLLYDERMLRGMLCPAEHPKLLASPPRHPDRVKNPKGAMKDLFDRHGRRYNNAQLARQFARHLEDVSRLRRCETFQRFAERVTGRAP